MSSINAIPLRVDPSFYYWAKEMIKKDPSLNQRKITKNLAKKKLIIGELLFNPYFEKQIMKSFNEVSVPFLMSENESSIIYHERKKINEKRFFL